MIVLNIASLELWYLKEEKDWGFDDSSICFNPKRPISFLENDITNILFVWGHK